MIIIPVADLFSGNISFTIQAPPVPIRIDALNFIPSRSNRIVGVVPFLGHSWVLRINMYFQLSIIITVSYVLLSIWMFPKIVVPPDHPF